MLQPAPLQSASIGQRLRAEWALLDEVVRLNPDRLRDPRQEDTAFFVTLLGTPGVLIGEGLAHTAAEHSIRILFPLHFPALPMEAYLTLPVVHPNVHPETGFLCLWDRHASTNTIEHALHKTAAMLGWQLFTTEAQHVMQPDAAWIAGDPVQLAALRTRLAAPPLRGIVHHDGYVLDDRDAPRRTRLSRRSQLL